MFGFEFLEYGFMRAALVAGGLTAVSGAVLGNFVVAARQAVVSDMLAHVALVGVGVGILWEVSPSLMALLVTLGAAVLLWAVTRRPENAPEAYSMLLLTGGLALALLLAHVNKNNPTSLETYLFGSLLTITPTELVWFAGLNALILLSLAWLWRPFLTLVFDAEYLRTQRRASVYEVLFLLLLGGLVGVGMKVIGGLLLGGLLVIPVLVVRPFARSFRQSVGMSVLVNVLCALGGIIASFYLDVPTGSAIILSLVGCFAVGQGVARVCQLG